MGEDYEHKLSDESGEHIDRTFPITDELAILVAAGAISIAEWEAAMRYEIELAYLHEWALGLGLLDGTVPTGQVEEVLELLSSLLQFQYEKLGEFAREIADGKLSAQQIAARARLYIASARQAFERGRGIRLQWPELPAYPGDGSTKCLTNCRCRWLQVAPNVFVWKLDYLAEHCSSLEVDAEGRPRGCLQRADLWNPLVIAG